MYRSEPIAIIGMGCRFPGAAGVEEFWALLERNGDAVTPVPADRFDVTAWYDPEPGTPGRLVSRHGGFLDDLYDFDAAFFGISPREARTMDPQQRLLLQIVWEAFEDAGIPPSSVRGSDGGVFVGQATAEYADATGHHTTADVRAMSGSRLRAVTAGRVSHAFDLRGPSLVLDTACSSSLVAVHTARQNLLTGECDLAVAAGVNVILSPSDAIAYSQGRMLARDGRCKFGDSSADGFVRSEGVGVVLLKRLSDALADGDPIRALLLGSAVTNDGDGSGLLLQPAVSGQTAMLRAAWRSAGVTPAEVDYVEAHGTGTIVGDGVELQALAEAVRDGEDSQAPLLVGSVKTNIGHAEAAAGIAGLIKTVLTAERRTIPGSLHLTSPRAELAEPGFPVTVVDRNTPLRPRGERAVLGVSSFGISGTNAHVVIGEYLPEPAVRSPAVMSPAVTSPAVPSDSPSAPEPDDARPHLLVLSARTPPALRRLALRHADHLGPGGRGRGEALRDLCRSAATGRDHHPFRLWAVGDTHDALADVLRALADGRPTPDGGLHEAGFGGPREVAFVFPGQGTQWQGMGRELLRTSDAFRAAMAECDAALREELGWSVVELLLDESAELTHAVGVVQPLLWAMEVALAAHWRALGVDPDLCIGHSMGEAAAACVAGALSLPDAARVIARRSSLMQRLAGRGAMLATELSPQQARDLVAGYGDGSGGEVCVAVENSPHSTVLAGDPAVLDGIARELERRQVLCRAVKVNVASHSPLMEELRDDLLSRLAALEPLEPHTPMFSTARCAPVDGAVLDAAYWMDNLRQPVRFADSVRHVAEERNLVFVEVSPHPALSQAVEDVQADAGQQPTVVTTLARQQSESTATTRALGRAFALGVTVDWRRWYGDAAARVPLPLYPWDVEDLRAETTLHAMPTAEAFPPAHASPGARTFPSAQPPDMPRLLTSHQERRIRLSRLGVAASGAGVTVRGVTPVPPVLYLEAVAETLRDLVGEGPVELRDVRIGDSLPSLPDAAATVLTITLDETPVDGEFGFRVEALVGASTDAVVCVTGTAQAPVGSAPVGHGPRSAETSSAVPLDIMLTRCAEFVPGAEFYRRAEAHGYSVAPQLQAVQQMWRRDGEAVARLHLPADATGVALEAGLLAMLGAWPHRATADGQAWGYAPLSFERVRLAAAPTGEVWCVVRFTADGDGDSASCDVALTTADNHLLAEFQGITMLRLPSRADASARRGLTAPPTAAAPAAVPTAEPAAEPAVAQRPAEWARRTAAEPVVPTGSDLPADRLIVHAATVLGTTVERVDPRRPLRDLGLDSLMAVQLRRILERDLGVEVSTSRLLGDESTAAIAAGLEKARAALAGRVVAA